MASSVNILQRPAAPDHLPPFADGRPRFLVTIDTEEEFDWGAPLRRDGHGVETIPAFARFVSFCAEFGAVPLFLIDYPVATAPATAAVLGPAIAAGRAEIGVHLHPWVNPPFDEEINDFNSFVGNLPPALEQEKFRRLHEAIVANLGVRPLIFRAGRYGAGPGTAALLHEAGLVFDTSVRSLFDYGAQGGPDYGHHPRRPYWLDRAAGLAELPVTSVFAGALRAVGQHFYPPLSRAPLLRALLARTRLLERIPLTPEGTTAAEAIRAIDAALAEDLPLLVFSFHSPSLAPGHTPYVRDADDLEAFYGWWRAVFDHLRRRGVLPTTVAALAERLTLASTRPAG